MKEKAPKRIKIGLGKVRIVYPDGHTITIESEMKANEEIKKKIDDSIFSLLPIFQKASDLFPGLIAPEPGFFEELKLRAEYSEEDAVNMLRSKSLGVEETTKKLLDKILDLSGVKGNDKERAISAMGAWTENEVHDLYLETTESTPQKVK